MATLSAAHRRYIQVETAINTVINAAFSALFVWIVFRGMEQVPLWGTSGLAIDLIPTCVAITLVSTGVLTLLTRMRLRRGRVESLSPARGVGAWLPRNIALRALTAIAIVTAAAVPLTVGALILVGADGASYNQVLVFKIIFGALLSLLISPPLLLRALADHSGQQR